MLLLCLILFQCETGNVSTVLKAYGVFQVFHFSKPEIVNSNQITSFNYDNVSKIFVNLER